MASVETLIQLPEVEFGADALNDRPREPANVFLSHSRKDATVPRQLSAALEGRRVDGWVDWEDIPPSADWWREVCAVTSARCRRSSIRCAGSTGYICARLTRSRPGCPRSRLRTRRFRHSVRAGTSQEIPSGVLATSESLPSLSSRARPCAPPTRAARQRSQRRNR